MAGDGDEVVSKYQPDMIWFDFELRHGDHARIPAADVRRLLQLGRRGHRESAVAHKFREIHEHTGILDFERGREDRLVPYPWLTDTVLAAGSTTRPRRIARSTTSLTCSWTSCPRTAACF